MMSVTICFFKQKTAYELRISDWSSDVCSSDLPIAHRDHLHALDEVRLRPDGVVGRRDIGRHRRDRLHLCDSQRRSREQQRGGGVVEGGVFHQWVPAGGGTMHACYLDRKSVVRERVCQYV